MTSINTGLQNPYAQVGAAYARAAAQPSLANTLAAEDTSNPFDANAATNLTLSDAAKAQLADGSGATDFSTVTSNTRAALDGFYAAVKVTSPLDTDGKATIDLSTLDRRALFAISTNNGGKFTPDEQTIANREIGKRFDAVVAPAADASNATKNYAIVYKAALDYLDGASVEEKATATWATTRAAVQTSYQAVQQHPGVLPPAISGDPVAAYLTRPSDAAPTTTDGGTTATQTFSEAAQGARAALDAQQAAATKAGKELVFDPGRKTGQLADLSGLDNRSLSAITLNQDNLFSNQEIYAAKTALNNRTRANILSALQQGQSSGDPSQVSLGILNAYSAMSAEERQAANWSPTFQEAALQSYKSTTSLLSMLKGG